MQFSAEPRPVRSLSRSGRILRTVAATAAIATAALGLAACSGSGAGGGSKTLTVWHYFTASEKAQTALMNTYGDMFEKANPGWKVDNVYVPYDQIQQKTINAAHAHQGPDIVVFNGAEAGTYALGNTLLPMDSYLSKFKDASELSPSVIHKVDGKTYGVQGYVNLLGLWYNKDVLDKAGVTAPPTTMDELEADMAKVKAAGDQGITVCGLPQGQGEWQAYPWLTDAGFNYKNPSADDLAKAFTTVQDWVSKGYLSKEAVTWDQTVPFQKWEAGGVAFAENGNWQIGSAKTDAKFNYGVVPMPLGPDGKVYLGGEGQGIGKYSKNPDMAFKYLEETFLSKEGQLDALKAVGSIPSRTDAASDPSIASDPLLKPFADSIKKFGGNYPDDSVKPASISDLQLAVGQAWSGVIGQQSSPKDAADALATKLKGYVG
jgi:multiple sugar transport system substrate-binding protein